MSSSISWNLCDNQHYYLFKHFCFASSYRKASIFKLNTSLESKTLGNIAEILIIFLRFVDFFKHGRCFRNIRTRTKHARCEYLQRITVYKNSRFCDELEEPALAWPIHASINILNLDW